MIPAWLLPADPPKVSGPVREPFARDRKLLRQSLPDSVNVKPTTGEAGRRKSSETKRRNFALKLEKLGETMAERKVRQWKESKARCKATKA